MFGMSRSDSYRMRLVGEYNFVCFVLFCVQYVRNLVLFKAIKCAVFCHFPGRKFLHILYNKASKYYTYSVSLWQPPAGCLNIYSIKHCENALIITGKICAQFVQDLHENTNLFYSLQNSPCSKNNLRRDNVVLTF